MQIDIPIHPIGRNFDITAVNAYRIRFRQCGRLRVPRAEFISVIGVNSRPVSLHFPVSGNLYVIPIRCTCVCFGNAGREIFVAVCIIEFPCAVKQLVVITLFVSAGKSVCPVIVCHECCSRIFFIDSYYLYIFPIRRLCFVCLRVCSMGKKCETSEEQYAEDGMIDVLSHVIYLWWLLLYFYTVESFTVDTDNGTLRYKGVWVDVFY